jgi:hypothetical protein
MILRGGSDKNAVPPPAYAHRLLGMLDKAKAFALLQQYQPDAVRDVEVSRLPTLPLVSDCGDYEIRCVEAVSLSCAKDTLVLSAHPFPTVGSQPLDHTPEADGVQSRRARPSTPSVADLACNHPLRTERPTG